YLQRLNLSHNHITEVDESLSLAVLRHLDLSHNRIKAFGADITPLETLHLNNNKLKSLPTALRESGQLLHLNLSQNKLKELPDLQRWFPNLRWLGAGQCQLTAIEGLPEQLYALLLAKNHLTELPFNWQQLTALNRLEMSNNPIAIDLAALTAKPNLSYLDLRRTATAWPGAEALLLCLPQLRHNYGGLSKKVQVSLAKFLETVPPTTIPQRRALLWQLWQGFAGSNVPTELLWSCLHAAQPTIIRVGGYYELLRRLPAKYGQLRGRKWWVAGRMSTPVAQLANRLKKQGVQLTPQAEEATGILLGHAHDQACHPPKTDLPVFGERDVLLWLDRREQRYLTQTKDTDQLSNLERTLRARDAATFQLGVRMMRAQGTPQSLVRPLLERWLYSSQAQRRDWEDILLPYLPGDLKIAIQAEQTILNWPTRRGWAGTLWKLYRTKK
ncbi:MAG: leucine-rich repeat domain-containing protein, partial [Bacteroidota bacterium]